MVVQLEKREALAKEAKIMERKKAQKSSKRLRQAATIREKQSRNNRSGSSGELIKGPFINYVRRFFRFLTPPLMIKVYKLGGVSKGKI